MVNTALSSDSDSSSTSSGTANVGTRVDRVRPAAAAAIGNALQFYDFFLYATAAAIVFNTVFFPSGRPVVSMIGAYASYAVGFVSRPLGGIVFGHVGDRFGRKITMVWTLSLMGVSTALIGLLPTFAQVGLGAPVMLVLLRLIQGFAAGGEWGGGILMCTENAPPGRRGFYGAFSQAGVGFGFVLSSGAFYAMQRMSGHGFLTWGWRVPFLLSVVVVAAGLLIRSRVPESAEFRSACDEVSSRQPVREVLREHGRVLLISGGLLLAEMCGPLLTTTFALAYGALCGVTSDILLLGVLLSMIVDTCAMLGFGYLSDRIGRGPVYAFGICGLGLFITPFFLFVGSGHPVLIVFGFILANGLFHAAMIGVQPALLTELFPVSVRASGLALTQSIASVLVGFLPLGATALFYATGSILPISGGMIAICMVSLLALRAAFRRLATSRV
ncbi:MFS transporter [Gluconacetobacter sp. Hr-1-5]|uniref:MFS transporter n=1 Tax=Gluconacetobacter sp. Hr-1-5 TaxID=3395370 RepID=UPI003B5227F5